MGKGMLRPLAAIVAAILISRPEMPEQTASRFAEVLRAEAQRHHFDPFTGIAIIHHESGWQPELVSANGEDYGLGQIRARYVGACLEDADPLHHPSPACMEVKRRLLQGEENIRIMAEMITRNRAFCRKKAVARKLSGSQLPEAKALVPAGGQNQNRDRVPEVADFRGSPAAPRGRNQAFRQTNASRRALETMTGSAGSPDRREPRGLGRPASRNARLDGRQGSGGSPKFAGFLAASAALTA